MHTPTQKQWATVIEKLYSVLPFALQEGSRLEMGESCVNVCGYPCGTVHCVGGWYAIAHWQDKAMNGSAILYFVHGAYKMARDLGFEYYQQFQDWAHSHSSVWGNNYGHNMFYAPEAYDHGNGPAKELADVIRHFEFVADNCKALTYE